MYYLSHYDQSVTLQRRWTVETVNAYKEFFHLFKNIIFVYAVYPLKPVILSSVLSILSVTLSRSLFWPVKAWNPPDLWRCAMVYGKKLSILDRLNTVNCEATLNGSDLFWDLENLEAKSTIQTCCCVPLTIYGPFCSGTLSYGKEAIWQYCFY